MYVDIIDLLCLFSIPAWRDPQCVPKAVGWEPKGGKLMPRFVSLAESMDPERYIVCPLFLLFVFSEVSTIPSVYRVGSANEVLITMSCTISPQFNPNVLQFNLDSAI